MSNSITSWYVTRTFIMPGNFQRSAALSDMLYDVAYGFTKLDAVTTISAGASTTLTYAGNKVIQITGSSLTHTISLPASPASGDPPIKIINYGVSNAITISGNGLPIMSGSTAGQITLNNPGDYIVLRYVNGTIGWGIESIKSGRIVTADADGSTTIQAHRFQELYVYNLLNDALAITAPTDSQIGEIVKVSIYLGAIGETPPPMTVCGVDVSELWSSVSAGQFITAFNQVGGWRVNKVTAGIGG